MNFWETLEKPFFVCAPMEDVTDAAFRSIIAKYSKGTGGKYVTFTEFTSADGLVFADEKGQKKLRMKFKFGEKERPIVAQIFSATPEHIEKAAAVALECGFDGVDINMGCPDRSVEKQGAGAALIKNPQLAQEIIYAAKKGAGDLPVSVKTRVGYDKVELKQWLTILLETNPAAITLHARTRKQMSKVPAQWNLIADAVAIRDAFFDAKKQKTLIIGNGDVVSIMHARERAEESGADGVMIGRGMFGNPWAMSEYIPTLEEKLAVLMEHSDLFEKVFDGKKSFATMRKHFSSYVEGFEGAKQLRIALMACADAAQVREVIEKHLAESVGVE
ncbi:MAG: tRNA-dihydrouridine synthase [Parcubacteria group bacterium]|nr:tRNA-dihydrouridine synthase [Parcubacteria group bacterium]|tara:strand:+ start:6009 stop:7001 length:993 start_codon:yes stop_codon:yes gene_type:complete